MGVAIVAPAGERVGVDVVAMERVSQRHARAVLSDDEWEALAPYAAVRPPLAWALKEAAAKAAGDPLRCFPDGLEIEPRPGGLRVRRSGPEQGEFEAGWETLGPFLYAWVHR
jgi:phosphopantetheinyl transferase